MAEILNKKCLMKVNNASVVCIRDEMIHFCFALVLAEFNSCHQTSQVLMMINTVQTKDHIYRMVKERYSNI